MNDGYLDSDRGDGMIWFNLFTSRGHQSIYLYLSEFIAPAKIVDPPPPDKIIGFGKFTVVHESLYDTAYVTNIT
jgi:hypothetical protein